MSDLYLPLRIAQEMRAQEERIAKAQASRPGTAEHPSQMANPLESYWDMVGENAHGPLNLDDFFSWAIGSTFCKKSYDGTYSAFNKRVLTIIKNRQGQGHSYADARKQIRQSVAFATMFRCWEQYKQVYRFDSDFIDELMRTNTVEIPVNVLRRLPFRCFYLDIEDTDWFPVFSGIFVYIGFDGKTGLPNLALFPVKDNGSHRDSQIKACHISGEQMTDWSMLVEDKETGEIYLQFTNQREFLTSVLPDADDLELFDRVLFVLHALLYLASNKPDILPSQKRKYVRVQAKKSGGPKPETQAELNLQDVGIRYGAAIRKVKKQTRETGTTIIQNVSGKARKPMVGHMRSAHWHRYWVGKGRTECIVKWIPPTFVSGTGKELPITIHKVTGK